MAWCLRSFFSCPEIVLGVQFSPSSSTRGVVGGMGWYGGHGGMCFERILPEDAGSSLGLRSCGVCMIMAGWVDAWMDLADVVGSGGGMMRQRRLIVPTVAAVFRTLSVRASPLLSSFSQVLQAADEDVDAGVLSITDGYVVSLQGRLNKFNRTLERANVAISFDFSPCVFSFVGTRSSGWVEVWWILADEEWCGGGLIRRGRLIVPTVVAVFRTSSFRVGFLFRRSHHVEGSPFAEDLKLVEDSIDRVGVVFQGRLKTFIRTLERADISLSFVSSPCLVWSLVSTRSYMS